MLSPLLIAILGTTSGYLVFDLNSYAQARRAFVDDPIGRLEPKFDWRLFVSRLALGVLIGVNVGLGVSTATNAAAGVSTSVALPTGGL